MRCHEVKSFIERHEWLGKMPTRPTHRFIATYKGKLAGVVVMATPNAFSDLLGKENKHLEKLISRGACISWSPKNLASALIMYSIRYMVKHTEFRFFTAYSDTEARELGTIYQACNFTYLGQSSGAKYSYSDPNDPAQDAFSDRLFRKSSFIRRKAIEVGIEWRADWHYGDKILWDQIPDEVAYEIKAAIQSYQDSCERRRIPLKHKYVYILGKTKAETKHLKNIFRNLNPRLVDLPYPKIRGPVENPSKNSVGRPCRISGQELTKRPNPWWPLAKEDTVSSKKFYSIKEVSKMFGISQWLLYHHAKTDATFPVVNVGVKKKLLIDPTLLARWIENKTKKFKEAEHNLISSAALLEA